MITDISILSGGREVVCGDNQGRITVRKLPDCAPAACQAVTDGPLLAVGRGSAHPVALYDHELAKLDANLVVAERRKIHCNGLIGGRFSADGQTAFVARRDEALQLIRLDDFGEIWTARVPWHRARPNRIALAADNSRALTLSVHDERHKLRVWSLSDGSCLASLQGYDSTFAIVTDGRAGYAGRFCAAANSHSIVMFDLESGDFFDSMDCSLDGHATALALDEEQRLLIGFQSGNVAICQVEVGHSFDFQSFEIIGQIEPPISNVRFVGNELAVAAAGDRLSCWPLPP